MDSARIVDDGLTRRAASLSTQRRPAILIHSPSAHLLILASNLSLCLSPCCPVHLACRYVKLTMLGKILLFKFDGWRRKTREDLKLGRNPATHRGHIEKTETNQYYLRSFTEFVQVCLWQKSDVDFLYCLK